MNSSVIYKTLFEITILHGYFLNSGNNEYDSLTSNQKKKLLNNYTFEKFISISPTTETEQILKNNKLLFQTKGEMMKIGVKTSIDDENLTFTNIPLDLTLNFIIRIKDFKFENYTDINLTKTQMYYFSNVTLVNESVTFKNISLINENIFIDDDYKLTEANTKIVLDTLNENEKRGVFGILSLKMQGDISGLNILDDDQKIITPTPNFKIHFNNRKTIWKYINTNATFKVETLIEKPLVQNGFVEILTADLDLSLFTPQEIIIATNTKYPNPSANSIKKINTKTYSEIFI